MSDTQFTPGPWSTNGSHIYAPDGEILAQVHNPGRCASDYPLVPNRDLMAAAPDLLRATEMQVRAEEVNANCEECEGEGDWAFCSRCSILFGDAIDARHAALARARGQS